MCFLVSEGSVHTSMRMRCQLLLPPLITVELKTFPQLDKNGALRCVMCDLEGQILSDPDCLRAGCKLDDLICPTAKGFVTLGGKKCLASVGTAVAFGGERGRLGFLGFVQTKGFLFYQIS